MKNKIPEHAKLVFKGILHDVYQWEQELFDGTFSTFEAIKKRYAVTTLAITKENKIIVNFEEQPNRPPFISLSGGITEEGATLIENAKRELEEETGYLSESWEAWFVSDVLKSLKIDWLNHFFIARACENIGHKHLDPGEKIEVKLFNFDEFIGISQDERFRNLEVQNMIKEMLISENREQKLEEFKNFLFKSDL